MTIKRLRNVKFGTNKLHVVVTGWALYEEGKGYVAYSSDRAYNDRAKSNGMVTEWVARNGWGNAVAFGYTKAECVADARRYCRCN